MFIYKTAKFAPVWTTVLKIRAIFVHQTLTEHALLFISTCPLHIRQYVHLLYQLWLWRNWPALLTKYYCLCLKSANTSLSLTNDTETNKSVWQAVFANLPKLKNQARLTRKVAGSYSLVFTVCSRLC